LARDQSKIDAHVAQWQHNRSLLGEIPASHPDWVVTVAFYTAVHAIDAALTFEGVTVCNHDQRFEAIAGLNRMLKVGTLYHPLYDLCRKVRYTADPNQWIPPAELERQVIRRYLLPLEQSIEGLIGKTLGLPTIKLSQPAAAPTQM
jgi:hypothetical protein